MNENAKCDIEIERKYIIKMPNIDILSKQEEYTESRMIQIYLPADKGQTHRIRKRLYQGKTVCTETKKVRIDKISSTEIEREISESEFSTLSRLILEDTRPINKARYTFVYKGQLFEIDVYPEWSKTAIMETELPSAECKAEMPPFIEIIKEVTGEKSYSNRGMAEAFPKEQL